MAADKPRAAICGIGNRLFGDDGIGPAAVEDLRRYVKSCRVLVADCGASPGQSLKKLLSFQASVVVVIGAVDMGRTAGTVQLLTADDARRMLLSTHKVDYGMFLRYLQNSLQAKIHFIGVQPKGEKNGDGLSPECRKSLMTVRDMAAELSGL